MGRKDLLKDLMDSPAPAPRAEAPARPPGYAKGAIGAVGQSIAELKSRALAEIDPDLIDPGGFADRIEDDPEGDGRLVASIRDYGQQVPVLVRPHPEAPGRFQIVYGRRRLRALRALGRPVRAMVRELDDRELALAQGQENAARRDLSFIEKAGFARQLRDAGYDRKVVCDALHVDKTVASRMLSVADRIPPAVVAAIGAAPSVGRDRWLRLADLLEKLDWGAEAAAGLASDPAAGSSDARFEGLVAALETALRRRGAATRAATRTAAETRLHDADGAPFGRARRRGRAVTLVIEGGEAAEFGGWLAESLGEIHRDWRRRRGE